MWQENTTSEEKHKMPKNKKTIIVLGNEPKKFRLYIVEQIKGMRTAQKDRTRCLTIIDSQRKQSLDSIKKKIVESLSKKE